MLWLFVALACFGCGIHDKTRNVCRPATWSYGYIKHPLYIKVNNHGEVIMQFRKPTDLNILWFRGHRTKSSVKPSWTIQIPDEFSMKFTCIAKWTPPHSVELIVTLYKDKTSSSFWKKDYMFVMEDVCASKRKKLAIFPCNLAKYASTDGETSDLEMEFKLLSKKIISAKCGLKIRSEFIKEGSAIDDDMQSNFSHMSEGEEFSRLSELIEVSDEDDIPEEDEPGEADRDHQSWQRNNFLRKSTDMSEEPPTGVVPVKTRSKPWSKFVAEMNSFEWKQQSMLRNQSSFREKKIGKRLKEKHKSGAASKDEPASKPSSETANDRPNNHKKRLISVQSIEEEDYNEDDGVVDEDGNRSGSSESLSSGRSKNGLKGSLKEMFKSVTYMTPKKMEAKLLEQNATICDLERENKRLVVENSKLQDMVYNFEKQRDELQTEISELQILVEDLKTRLSQSEAEHKQLREEERELLARMNLCGWLCKRGIKGITGRVWRRRWFSTDNSGKLYYYKQSTSSTPQGFIDLDLIISVQDQCDDLQDKNKASFNVVVDKRKYELMARDSEEKQKWIDALDYLRHWRCHTGRFPTNNKELNDED